MKNIQCPNCSTEKGVPEKYLNKKVKCVSCGSEFTAEKADEATSEETSLDKYERKPWLGRIGAIAALLALLFLPIASCQTGGFADEYEQTWSSTPTYDTWNGLGVVISALTGEFPLDIGLFVIISLACAAVGIAAKSAKFCWYFGGGGIASIFLGYIYSIITTGEAIFLRIGSFIAITGFIVLVVEGFKQNRKSKILRDRTEIPTANIRKTGELVQEFEPSGHKTVINSYYSKENINTLKHILIKYPIILALVCIFFIVKWNGNENRKYDLESRYTSLSQEYQKHQETLQFNRNNVELTIIAAIAEYIDNPMSSGSNHAHEMDKIEKELGSLTVAHKRRVKDGRIYLTLAIVFAGLGFLQFFSTRHIKLTTT